MVGIYLPLLAAQFIVPSVVMLSPSTVLYKTAGDGAITYAAVIPVAIIMTTNIVANIALFIVFNCMRGNLIVPTYSSHFMYFYPYSLQKINVSCGKELSF